MALTTGSIGVIQTFSEYAAYREVEVGRAALRELDWPQVAAFFAGLPDQHARSFFYRALGKFQGTGTDAFLAEQAENETGSSVARTLYAERVLCRGWGIRGARRAKYVGAEKFRAFHHELAVAEQVLDRVRVEDPGNASAWTASLSAAVGLQMSQDEARWRCEQAMKADPHHLRAQDLFFKKLLPKWGGSWDDAHAFARTCMVEAPMGAPNAVLVVDGHIERWLELGRGFKALRYLRGAAVRNELYEAAERSVLSPDFGRPYGWVTVRSTFAMAFCLLKDQQAAAAQFRALGRYASNHPWHYTRDKEARYQHLRNKALTARAVRRGTI